MARPFETELSARYRNPILRSTLDDGTEPHLQTGATGASLGWADSIGRPELEPFSESYDLAGGLLESTGIDTTAEYNRSYRGLGPQVQRSDERLREAICERLTEDPYVDPSDVTIEVHDGEVSLEGTVAQRFMKYRMEDLVDSFTGVKEIHNRVRVASRPETTNVY